MVYKYQHLPLLAKFILDGRIRQFAVEQLQFSRQYDVPLLKLLSHYSDEQLIDLSSKSLEELLRYLANNNAAEQISSSLQKWLANQMEVVDKYDVVAEDITLLNHVRGKSLKSFAAKFYSDHDALIELLGEIDDYLLASNTAAANTFIDILKGRIHDEEEFRAKLSNALPAFLYVFNVSERKEIHTNHKLKDILGYTEQQLQHLSDDFYKPIMHPEDRDKLDAHRKQYAGKNGAVGSFEFRLKDSQGVYRWIRNYETNLRTDANGEILDIIGVAFDVTGEKQILDALAKNERQLLEAQSLASIGSFEWDITGEGATANTPEVYRIFELEELENFEEFMQYVHKDDVQKVKDEVEQSFKTGAYDCVYRYLRNGKEKIIWSKGVVTIVNGRAIKMVGTVQDITTIKRIEAQLTAKTLELQKSNESLQQFASVASHDLKEPLRKIAIYGSKILGRDSEHLSAESKSALSRIMDNVNRMQVMIDDILEFSFFEGEQQKQETNLEEVLSEVKDLLSETITDKKATITSDGLPFAYGVPSQMRQLFQNLLSNALKFSKPNVPPVINITHSYLIDKPAISTERTQLIICITDNGIGFEESSQEKIFTLFYRLHSRSKFEGSGLGLSICNKIVEKHGGKITAESTPGKGSMFKIELPLVRPIENKNTQVAV